MILISPYSRKLRNGNKNPKNYPYWENLIKMLKEIDKDIIQIGIDNEKRLVSNFKKNLPLQNIKKLISMSNIWISIDNFLPHVSYHLQKQGIVLWGHSDPIIFGYPENINLLKNRKYLRKNQFDTWENCEYNEDAFVKPGIIINELNLLNYEQILKREG